MGMDVGSVQERIIKSMLFTPALRVDRFASGLRSGADVALADLEDSVAPNVKAEARASVVECLSQPRPDGVRVAVRVNALDSQLGLEDMAVVLDSPLPPDLILIPKVESAQTVRQAEKMIEDSGKAIKLLALIESAEGVYNVFDIARSSPILAGLVFGAADYTNDIGAEICWDSLFYPRTKIVCAAKLAKIQSIDTPYFEIEDLEGLAKESFKTKCIGFTGRCVIHPKQLDAVQEAFTPSKEVLEYARKVVAAANNSDGNICKVDGNMVGTPIIRKARMLLENFDHGGTDTQASGRAG